MKKIIVFYPYETGKNAFSGGVPKVIVSNLIAIKNNGDEPYLILPTENNGLISFLEKEHHYCNIIPINFKSLSLFSDTKGFGRYTGIIKNLKGFIFGRKNLKKAVAKINPDVIHFHEVINFPLLNIFPRAKVVLHLHSYRFTSYGVLLDLILKSINKNCNLVISPTKSILNALGDKLKVKSIVIDTPYLDLNVVDINKKNNPIYNQLLKDKKSGKIIFSFVGRICSIKRIDHFIKAISKLDNNIKSKIVFSIVGGTNTEGDITYKKELETLIKKNNLSDIVIFHGYINPIESILPTIDYGIILSKSEAVPMIGIEYMRFNIPIIGYNAPGINDFLVNGKNGYLLKNGSINDLSKKLQIILSNFESQYDFKNSIPQIFERHTIEKFASKLKSIY